jgi:hypothetical protein
MRFISDLTFLVFMGVTPMQEKDDKEKQKHPTEMTTDEALDYVFGPEIAEELKREAGKSEQPEPCEPNDLAE